MAGGGGRWPGGNGGVSRRQAVEEAVGVVRATGVEVAVEAGAVVHWEAAAGDGSRAGREETYGLADGHTDTRRGGAAHPARPPGAAHTRRTHPHPPQRTRHMMP